MNKDNKKKQASGRQKYEKPVLKKLGKVTKLTLKSGSRTDFGLGTFSA